MLLEGRAGTRSPGRIIPTSPPGEFKVDPAFTLAGTSSTTSFSHTPAEDELYYVVLAVGTDLLDGVAGHYGE